MGGRKKKQPWDIEKVFQIICGVGQDNQTHLQRLFSFFFFLVHLTE